MEKMLMRNTFSLLAILYVFLVACAAEGTKSGYIFTSPRTVKEGANNELQLFRSGCTDDGNLKVGLYYSNNSLMFEKDYQLKKGEITSFFNFHVPSFDDEDNYYGLSLQINGTLCGETINGSDKVDLKKQDTNVIIIQTDKPFYKPGQTVKFRVLKVDKFLKSSRNPNDLADVYVEDPQGTRLFQYDHLSLKKGLLQKELPLSDDPVKGSWKITVSSNDSTVSTNFDVKEYVLPKFESKIKFPPFVLTTAETIPIQICAKYTYGEPLRGHLNLNLTLDAYEYWNNQNKRPVLQESVKLDGCYNYTLNVSLIDPDNQSYYRIKAIANIIENGTGVQINKTEYLQRESTPLTLNFNTDQNQRQYFKPGLPYNGRLRVTNPDSSPAGDEPIEICATVSRQRVIYGWWSTKKEKYCSNYTSDADGYVQYTLLPQNVDSISVSLEAKSLKYADYDKYKLSQPQTSMSLSPFYSPSGSFIQIASIKKPLECGKKQPITFLFTSKENAKYKFYVEVTKGGESVRKGEKSVSFNVKNDVSAKYEKEGELINQTMAQIFPTPTESTNMEDCPAAKDSKYLPPIGETEINISVDASLPPSFRLLIFYVRDDQEIVADSQTIDVGGCFNNKVDFKFSDKIKQPGTNTTISVKSAPDSLCGLKIVDKSVSLLDSNDQLTKDKIFELLGAMDTNNYYTPNPCYGSRVQPGLQLSKIVIPRPPGSTSGSYEDSYASFQNAGYLVISNLKLFTRPCQDNSYNDFPGRPFPIRPFYGGVARFAAKSAVLADVGGPAGAGAGAGGFNAPIAMNSIPNTQSAVAIRDNFAETWLFDLVMTGSDGKYVSKETLPDTITDWIGSAVCISPKLGLGLSNTTTITGFQAFFISYTLPASVIRGEEFYIVVSIFNYVDKALPITVSLRNSPGLQVTGDSINGDICIQPQTSSSLKLKLKGTAVGKINITVSAETAKSNKACGNSPVYDQLARDAITQPLEVNAEGFPAEKVKSQLFCPSDEKNRKFSQVLNLSLPDDVVPDSLRAYVDVSGNVMGPALQNLNNLVQIPTGCGEQNIVKFTPNYLALDYLSHIRKLTDRIKSKAIQNLNTGYQRELNYRRSNGSFSAFGPVDKEGSMFLTAFVLFSFYEAQEYITIDKSLLTSMQKFIVSYQQDNGCFQNIGQVIDHGFEGGLENEKNPNALTAYVVQSLLISKYENQTVIDKAMSCLKQGQNLTFYETFLYAYAEALAGNKEEARKIVDKIKPFANTNGGMEYYGNPGGTKTLDIETAAYAILTNLLLGVDASDIQPLVRYLATNLNPTGGFYSTQDTVVGLHALTEYAKIVYKNPVDITVSISGGLKEKVKVTENNRLLVQRSQVSIVPSQLKVDATGTGCCLLQTSLRYNTKTSPNENKFSLKVVGNCIDKNCKHRRISVSVSYIPKGKKAGMSVVQIKMVSGAVPVKDSLQKLLNDGVNNILRFDVEGNDVILYFSEVSNNGYRFSFDVDEVIEVVNPQPATAKVFDYYAPEKMAMTSYSFGDQKEDTKTSHKT